MNQAALGHVEPFVSNLDRKIFTVRNLPEEVVAVLFAKYSRSPRGLRETLSAALQAGELLRPAVPDYGLDYLDSVVEQAKQFHEKNVLGYGHASVAEQAVAHIAVEDVSLLAAKAIEDNRIGCAYTEQSTRYVEFNPERLVPTPLLLPHEAKEWNAGLRYLTQTYAQLFPLVREAVAKKYPEAEKSVVKAKTCDLLRGLLPLGCLTRLGITANARALAHLISKLASTPQVELRAIGSGIRSEVSQEMPTLLKYSDPSEYRRTEAERLSPFLDSLRPERVDYGARDGSTALVDYDGDAEEKVLTAILYRQLGCNYRRIRAHVQRMGDTERDQLMKAYLDMRGPREQGGRALEAAEFLFEIELDLGAWRDVQRHRICTQIEQTISCDLGYDLPPELYQLDVAPYQAAGSRVERALMDAAKTWRSFAESCPAEAVYLVPLAYRRRFLVKMNLRQICAFVQLRSGRQGHPNYRAVAQAVYRAVAKLFPRLATAIRVDLEGYALAREAPPGKGKA